MSRCQFALFLTLSCSCLLALQTPDAAAQQFQDQTTTRFPQPNLLEYTSQLTIGDIDGDGDLDLIFANGNGYTCPITAQVLRIFINDGTGHFTDESVARTGGLTFKARGAELGDVDGDGDLDIIVAQDCATMPALLINNGSGFFTDQTSTRLPAIVLSSSRAQFADVDNDGDLDLYLVNGGSSRFGTAQGKLYLNDGTGHFTDATATNMPSGTVAQPMDCIFGDIDGDLDLDLRIASRAGTSKIYKNDGTGHFTSVASPSDNNCYSYDFGDIDGDGDLDMLGVNASPSTPSAELLLKNNGSGTYAVAPFPAASIDDNDSKFFDYDNDGDLDLIVASLGSTERIYTNNGSGVFTLTGGMITAVSDSSLDVKVADLDGDGRLDVVTAQGESGNFANRIYMNVTGPVDTIAPKFPQVEQILDTMNTAGPYYARAVIYDGMTSDRGFHDKGIFLNYTVNGGSVQQVPMKWVGNSEWRGGIPGQTSGSAINYYITAKDFAGNVGTSTTKSFNILHPPCPADLNGNLTVNVDDLLQVINNWGATNTTYNINAQDFEFVPSATNTKSGDTITFNWINDLHTATSGSSCTPDGRFSQALSSGTPSFSYVIPSNYNGTIPFFCIPHCTMGMTGTITVTPFAGNANGDNIVNVDDLLAVINAWGPCP